MTAGRAASTVTDPRGWVEPPPDRPSRSRSSKTNRVVSSAEGPGSRQAYSTPAPAGPQTMGRRPALAPAAASASSTSASRPSQNVTRTTVLGEPAAGTMSHHGNDTSDPATTGVPPAAAISSDIRRARSVTPDSVPSSSTPTRKNAADQASSTADGTSAEPAA